MAYGRKYYKEFDGYNAATGQTYSVLVDIYEDGFAGSAIEIEEISASPLQLSLDSSGDPLYTAIKKTSATFNIINTNQFDYSEFYTSNAKKYKMMITSTVFNWTGYLVPQAVSFDLATNGEFSLTASDGLHLLQSIDYVAAENDMTTLAAFLTDIETKIGLSTFNRTSTVNTEYGDIWNSLIYKGMLVGKTYEEAFEMVLKAIGMQVRYWKITPIISIESALQTASVKCVNDYPELNFLAPIKTAKLTKNITTLPSAFKNALVDDASDLKPRAANSYNTLTNWTVVSDNGLVVFDIGANETDRKANKYKYINMFVKPTNAPYDSQRLTGNEGSYFQLRPVQKTPFTLSFNANFGNISSWGRSSADGYRSYVDPVKWSSIKWGLYDSISNKSYSKTTNSWSITGTPTSANANELKVTDPADSFVDVYIPIPAPSGITANLRFYLFTGEVEYDSSAPGGSKTNRLSIKSIDIDGEYVVSENELYTSVNGVVAVGDNIDVLDYEVDFGSVPVPPLNTSLYYGSAFFDNNLSQLNNVIIGANTVSHEQYLFNTILYTQNEIRKKVYTANVNMLTNVSPFWLKTTLKSDVVMVNACNFDFKTSQLNGEFTEIMPYVYREWAITSESEIGSSDWGGSGGTTGTSGGGGTVDTSNFVVKTGATDQNIEGIVRPDNLLSNGAVVAKSLAPTDVIEWPQAGQNVDGVVRYDNVTIKRNASGQLYAIASGGTTVSWGTEVANQSVQLIVAAVTKTLALASHTHNYQPLDSDLTAIAALAGTNGLLKKTAADTWVLDTTAYLTGITKAMVEAVLTGNITTHTHSQYLLSSAYTAADILTKLGTVDGSGSGLDADLLDGLHATDFFKAVLNSTTDVNNVSFWQNKGGKLYNAPNAPYNYYAFFSFGEDIYQGQFNAWNNNLKFRAGDENGIASKSWLDVYTSGNSNKKTVDWAAKNINAVNGYFDGSVVAKYLSSTFATDWPVMTSSVQGVAKAGNSLIANAGTLDQRNRHYTTTTAYTDAAARDVTAKIALGTGNMTSGTLDQIQLSFAPLTTTFGLTANVIVTQTGAGIGLIVSFREDAGTGRWYICVYNQTGATVVRDGIYLSISGKQTV